MRKELTRDEELKSINALRDYYIAIGRKNEELYVRVDVLFKKENKVAFTTIVPITISYDSMTRKIDIYWEDAGYENFNEIGLSGNYYCHYVKMKYLKTKGILEINEYGSNKKVRVHISE